MKHFVNPCRIIEYNVVLFQCICIHTPLFDKQFEWGQMLMYRADTIIYVQVYTCMY